VETILVEFHIAVLVIILAGFIVFYKLGKLIGSMEEQYKIKKGK